MTLPEFVSGIWSQSSVASQIAMVTLGLAIIAAVAFRSRRLTFFSSPVFDALAIVPVFWLASEMALRTIVLVDCWFGCCYGMGELPWKLLLLQDFVRVVLVGVATVGLKYVARFGTKALRIPWMGLSITLLALVADMVFLALLDGRLR